MVVIDGLTKPHGTLQTLFRTFFAQFFTSDTVTSDVQMRQTIMSVLAFVLTPCFLILLGVFPQFQLLVIRVGRVHPPPGVITRATAVRNLLGEDMLEWSVAVLVGYSMITTGLVTAFVWDALSFDQRDAMVLGPLPVSASRIVLAKLAALAAFLLGASVSVNLINAFVFAIETSDQFGFGALVAHFFGCLLVTVAAATLVFSTLVLARSLIAIAGGARLAEIAGSILQFSFVLLLLAFVVSVFAPPAHRGRLVIPDTNTPPLTWFVAWFEVLRRSERGSWPEFAAMGHRAALTVLVAVAGATASAVLAFRRQMRLALSPAARPGPLGFARLPRRLARAMCRADGLAGAVADFVLITIARNRLQQAPIAINAAIGFAMVVVGLARLRGDTTSTFAAMPLLLAFWTAVGMRASFFVPSHLPAAWTFHVNAPERAVSYIRGVRAAAIAAIAPPAALLAYALSGWHKAGVVLLLVVALVDTIVVLTIDFLPFTRPYRPGHAKLKTRWPLYLAGGLVFSYGLPHAPVWLVVAAIACLEAFAPRMAERWRLETEADDADQAVLILTCACG